MTEKSLNSIKVPIWKKAIRSVVLAKWVNAPLVEIIKLLPFTKSWRDRIPVKSGRANYLLRNQESIWLYDRGRCGISKELFWNDSDLGTASDRLALEIAIILAADTNIFLDIGAYTGIFAMAVSKSHSGVTSYAYEIVPENYLLLVENVIKNDLIGQVKPHICGVSSTVGNIVIPYSMGGGVMATSIALDWSFGEGVNIPLDTLDNMYEGFSGQVSMKIDVEGFELQVLEGAKNMLSKLKPDIICEILTRSTTVANVQDLLTTLGYNFYHITDKGLALKSEVVPVKHERDWLFTTKKGVDLEALGLPISSV